MDMDNSVVITVRRGWAEVEEDIRELYGNGKNTKKYIFKKSSPYPKSSQSSLMLSSRNTLLYFTFWLMVHFKLIFVKGGRSMSRFIFFFACG